MKWAYLLWLIGLILYSVTFEGVHPFYNHIYTLLGAGLWLVSVIIIGNHFRKKS